MAQNADDHASNGSELAMGLLEKTDIEGPFEELNIKNGQNLAEDCFIFPLCAAAHRLGLLFTVYSFYLKYLSERLGSFLDYFWGYVSFFGRGGSPLAYKGKNWGRYFDAVPCLLFGRYSYLHLRLFRFFIRYAHGDNAQEKFMLDERKRNVLFLEGDRGTREMVILTLRLSGMKVLCAKTKDEAWSLAQTYTFDLFLLDSLLPNGDSLQLCRDLRKFAPNTPIVFCSDLEHQADKQKGLDAGANNYLTKPFSANLAETLFQTNGSQPPNIASVL